MAKERMLNNSIRKKLGSRAGESIAETLVALLISALAIVMLAGAVFSGSNIVRRSRAVLDDYYSSNEDIATVDGSWSTDSITITETGTTDPKKFTISVKSYTNDTFQGNTVKAYILNK